MTIKLKLKNAINAIEDAARRLRNARNTSNNSDITRALHELDDAEGLIQRAIRELPD